MEKTIEEIQGRRGRERERYQTKTDEKYILEKMSQETEKKNCMTYFAP